MKYSIQPLRLVVLFLSVGLFAAYVPHPNLEPFHPQALLQTVR